MPLDVSQLTVCPDFFEFLAGVDGRDKVRLTPFFHLHTSSPAPLRSGARRAFHQALWANVRLQQYSLSY